MVRGVRTIIALVVTVTAMVQAQEPARQLLVQQRDPRDTVTPLFMRRDVWLAGAGLAGTVALMPLDRSVAAETQESETQGNSGLMRGARAFNGLGGSGVLVFAVGAYGVGRLTQSPRLARLGLRTTEAIVLSAGAGGLIKGIVGRARPATSPNDPGTYRVAAGFTQSAFTSFPSGHTTAAFAAASVVTAEMGEWWPRTRWYVGPVAYGAASLVGAARIYTNRHWASDVFMGAALGTMTGLKVVQFHHTHPGSWLDRLLLSTDVAPSRRGVQLGWHVAAP